MPRRAMCSGARLEMSWPSKTTLPVLRTVPDMARRVVVLPAPLAPRSATMPPASTLSDTPCSALMGPYAATTPFSSSCAILLRPQVGLDDARVGLYFARGAFRDHAAEVEHDDAIADSHDKFHMVLANQPSLVPFGLKPPQFLPHP